MRQRRPGRTILDPDAAPATELGALYGERWEAENTLAEWKTHQLGSRNIVTSKSPGLVRHEIYAHLATHAAVRTLMHQVATCQAEPIDPDRLSFTAALRAVRRSVTSTAGTFPPEGLAAELASIARELREEINPPRRLRVVIRQSSAEDVPVPVMQPRSSPTAVTGQEAG